MLQQAVDQPEESGLFFCGHHRMLEACVRAIGRYMWVCSHHIVTNVPTTFVLQAEWLAVQLQGWFDQLLQQQAAVEPDPLWARAGWLHAS
jgi:hypothetical protein